MKISKARYIEYKGEKILVDGGFYWFNTIPYITLPAAKKAIDTKLKLKDAGLY